MEDPIMRGHYAARGANVTLPAYKSNQTNKQIEVVARLTSY